MLNALMQVAINGPPVLQSMSVVESAMNNWFGISKEEKIRQQSF